MELPKPPNQNQRTDVDLERLSEIGSWLPYLSNEGLDRFRYFLSALLQQTDHIQKDREVARIRNAFPKIQPMHLENDQDMHSGIWIKDFLKTWNPNVPTRDRQELISSFLLTVPKREDKPFMDEFWNCKFPEQRD